MALISSARALSRSTTGSRARPLARTCRTRCPVTRPWAANRHRPLPSRRRSLLDGTHTRCAAASDDSAPAATVAGHDPGTLPIAILEAVRPLVDAQGLRDML